MRYSRVVLLLHVVVFSIGCGASLGTPGDQLLRNGDHGAAVAAFEAEEEVHPGDPGIKRKLALALLRAGQPTQALQKLDEASALDGETRSSLLFRAQAYETLGELDPAIRFYDRYLRAGGSPRGVRARLDALGLQKAARHVEHAMAREDSLQGTLPDERTLVVPDFANTADVEDLAPLEKGLAAVLITDLSLVERFRVLERRYLNTLIAELDLTGTGATGTAPVSGTVQKQPAIVRRNAPRLGQLLGAGTFVQGVFTPLGSGRIQMNTSIVHASTGEAIANHPVEGELDEILLLEKELVYQVLESLGIEPTPREQEKIDRLPTQSFQSFFAYSRGLYLRDLGLIGEAQAAFDEAVAADGEFEAASYESERGTDEDFADVVEQELEATLPTPAAKPAEILGSVVGDVGGGPAPDEGEDITDGGEMADEQGVEDSAPTAEDRVNTIPDFPQPPGVSAP